MTDTKRDGGPAFPTFPEEGHTPEPWKLIWHGNETYPFPLSIHTEDDTNWIARDGTVSSKANARRIVAAVNHTRNIPNEALEAVRLEDVVGALRRLQRWGSCSVEKSSISAETYWREFPKALEEAKRILSHFPARSSTVEPEDG